MKTAQFLLSLFILLASINSTSEFALAQQEKMRERIKQIIQQRQSQRHSTSSTQNVPQHVPEDLQGSTAGPIQLSHIPESAEIIFSSSRAKEQTEDGFDAVELYTMEGNGNHITRITWQRHVYNHFDVSPDRTKIVVVKIPRDTNGNGRLEPRDLKEVWVLDLEHQMARKISGDFDAGWGGVVWSPDGRYVYTSMSQTGRYPDIYRINPTTGEMDNLTSNLGRALRLPSSEKFVSDVGVSYDGAWLTFIIDPVVNHRSRHKTNIVVMSTNGRDAKVITNGGELPSGKHGLFSAGDFDPEFSPDGQQIVFERATNAGMNFGMTTMDIMVVDLRSGTTRKISSPESTSTFGIPHWSPDNRIVFSEWNQSQMYVGAALINPDGSSFRQLRDSCGTHARWIPQASPTNES